MSVCGLVEEVEGGISGAERSLELHDKNLGIEKASVCHIRVVQTNKHLKE